MQRKYKAEQKMQQHKQMFSTTQALGPLKRTSAE